MRNVFSANPFIDRKEKIKTILLAHSLVGTVRGKSVNGLLIHEEIFDIVAIVDQNAVGVETSKVCKGVEKNVPVYATIKDSFKYHKAEVAIILCDPTNFWHSDIKTAISNKLDIVNTSFQFIENNIALKTLSNFYNVNYYDLRNVAHMKAYPNPDITKRKARVVYVTGTDCGLGKRTATFAIYKEAKKHHIKVAMLATGQTGLLLGQDGTVIDATVIEYSNGIVSQQVCQLDGLGFDLILVEGQSDIFHPANSAVAISILHGANPDAIIIVHDEKRTKHKGFEENSELYQMHPLKRYIETIKMLSLPCGPEYKTIGIATIGEENLKELYSIYQPQNIAVADVLKNDGASVLLKKILAFCNVSLTHTQISYNINLS